MRLINLNYQNPINLIHLSVLNKFQLITKLKNDQKIDFEPNMIAFEWALSFYLSERDCIRIFHLKITT